MSGGGLVLLVVGTLAGIFALRCAIIWFVIYRTERERFRLDAMQQPFGDFPNRDDLNFHARLISTEAKRHHG